MSKFRILLIDDEQAIREIIALGISLKVDCIVEEAEDGVHAVEILNKDSEFSLIICDYNMPNMNGGQVYKFVQEKKLDIPFVLCSSDSPEDHNEFSDGKVFSNIVKPCIMDGIDDVFAKLAKDFDHAIEFAQKFIPVSLDLLFKIKNIPVDLYIKINDDKVLKVARSGETFDKPELRKFTDKGLNSLYIELCDGELLINKLEENLFKLFTNDTISDEQKITSVRDAISSVTKTFGFSAQLIELTNKNIDYTMDLIKKDNALKSLLDRMMLMENSFLPTNAVICAHISNALAKELEIFKDNKEEVIKKLTFACFVQDLSLESSEVKTYENFQKLMKEDAGRDRVRNFKNHPNASAELIGKSKSSMPDLDRILQEHHERPDGKGFPRQIIASRFSPMGAVLAFSNAVSEVIYRNKKIDEMSTDLIIQSLDFDDCEDKLFKAIFEAFKKLKLF